MNRSERKREFIRVLAEYLAGNQVHKSIQLQFPGRVSL